MKMKYVNRKSTYDVQIYENKLKESKTNMVNRLILTYRRTLVLHYLLQSRGV